MQTDWKSSSCLLTTFHVVVFSRTEGSDAIQLLQLQITFTKAVSLNLVIISIICSLLDLIDWVVAVGVGGSKKKAGRHTYAHT